MANRTILNPQTVYFLNHLCDGGTVFLMPKLFRPFLNHLCDGEPYKPLNGKTIAVKPSMMANVNDTWQRASSFFSKPSMRWRTHWICHGLVHGVFKPFMRWRTSLIVFYTPVIFQILKPSMRWRTNGLFDGGRLPFLNHLCDGGTFILKVGMSWISKPSMRWRNVLAGFGQTQVDFLNHLMANWRIFWQNPQISNYIRFNSVKTLHVLKCFYKLIFYLVSGVYNEMTYNQTHLGLGNW